MRELDEILEECMVTVVLFVTAGFPQKVQFSYYVESVLDEIADPRTNVRVVDVGKFSSLVRRYAITQTPTIIVFKFKEEVKRYTVKPWRKKIIEVIRSHLEPFDLSFLRNLAGRWN